MSESSGSSALFTAGKVGLLVAAGYVAYKYVKSALAGQNESEEKQAFKAILFDMDGTILETADIWYELLRASVKEFTGRELTYEEWRPYFGQSMQKNVSVFLPSVDQAIFDKYCEDNYGKYLEKMHILEGAEEVVNYCSKLTNGLISIVTNCPAPITAQTLSADSARILLHEFGGRKDNQGRIIENTLRAVHAEDIILPHMYPLERVKEAQIKKEDEVTEEQKEAISDEEDAVLVTHEMASESVKKDESNESAASLSMDTVTKIPPKPHPYMIYEACRRLGVKPEECLFVGDSKFDMMAAKSAGCFTVGINVDGGDGRISKISDLISLLKAEK